MMGAATERALFHYATNTQQAQGIVPSQTLDDAQ
jgi:hypothetical protein